MVNVSQRKRSYPKDTDEDCRTDKVERVEYSTSFALHVALIISPGVRDQC